MNHREFDLRSIAGYAVTELPGTFLSATFGGVAAEVTKRLTGSDLASSIAAAPASALGFFIGKTTGQAVVRGKQYVSGEESLTRDIRSIAKSTSLSATLNHPIKIPVQYALQSFLNVPAYIAPTLAGLIPGAVSTLVRYKLDIGNKVFNLRKKETEQGLEQRIIQN